jgi:hypothetical protein
VVSRDNRALGLPGFEDLVPGATDAVIDVEAAGCAAPI